MRNRIFISRRSFTGDIISSHEGQAFFVEMNEYGSYPLSTDFERVVTLINR